MAATAWLALLMMLAPLGAAFTSPIAAQGEPTVLAEAGPGVPAVPEDRTGGGGLDARPCGSFEPIAAPVRMAPAPIATSGQRTGFSPGVDHPPRPIA
jgi:hypothetical protein